MNNNIILAKFMDVFRGEDMMQPPYELDYVDDGLIFIDEAKYSTDWNWLMPVIKKLNALGIPSKLFPNARHAFLLIQDSLRETDIKKTYELVVEFIQITR